VDGGGGVPSSSFFLLIIFHLSLVLQRDLSPPGLTGAALVIIFHLSLVLQRDLPPPGLTGAALGIPIVGGCLAAAVGLRRQSVSLAAVLYWGQSPDALGLQVGLPIHSALESAVGCASPLGAPL
jgi:hypothetical protein